MSRCRSHPARARAAGLVLVLSAGCADGAGPGELMTYELRAYNGRPLPAQAVSVAAGATHDIVSASLQFSGGLQARGTVRGRMTLRVGEPGAAPREEARVADGVYAWRGDALEVTFGGGGGETFAVEAGGQRLRTTAVRCPAASACDAVLNVSEYERRAAAP